MAALVCLAVAALATRLLVLTCGGLWRQPNFRGRLVGKGGGLAVVGGATAGWLACRVWPVQQSGQGLLVFAVILMAGLGWLDDHWGQAQVKGLKGHLREWWRGRGDTALVKAAGGAVAGLLVAYWTGASWWLALLDVACVSLAANALNLLDLRPGRALKGFGVGVLFLTLLGAGTVSYLLPLLGAVLAYAPYDLDERVMLGDAGANALGVALGMAAALALPWPAKLGMAVILAVLHAYAERQSISNLIDRVSWLSYFDRLGRRA